MVEIAVLAVLAQISRCDLLDQVRGEKVGGGQLLQVQIDEFDRGIAACRASRPLRGAPAKMAYGLEEARACFTEAIRTELDEAWTEQLRNCVYDFRAGAAQLAREREIQRREENERKARQASEEEERKAVEKREAELRAELDTPDGKVRVLSGVFCRHGDRREKALAEISAKKKYSKLGGVQNNAKLYELQNRVRTADEERSKVQKLFAAAKRSLPRCDEPIWSSFVACIEEDIAGDDARCNRVEVRRLLELTEAYAQTSAR